MSFAQATILSSLLLLARSAPAQDIVSARAGLLYPSQGRVLLNDKPVAGTLDSMPIQEVNQGDHVRTESGRADLFFGPWAVLRLDENTRAEILDIRFSGVRLRLTSGSAGMELARLGKSDSVTVVARGVPVRLERPGVYRFDLAGERPCVQVFAGGASVATPGWRQRRKLALREEARMEPLEPSIWWRAPGVSVP